MTVQLTHGQSDPAWEGGGWEGLKPHREGRGTVASTGRGNVKLWCSVQAWSRQQERSAACGRSWTLQTKDVCPLLFPFLASTLLPCPQTLPRRYPRLSRTMTCARPARPSVLYSVSGSRSSRTPFGQSQTRAESNLASYLIWGPGSYIKMRAGLARWSVGKGCQSRRPEFSP